MINGSSVGDYYVFQYYQVLLSLLRKQTGTSSRAGVSLFKKMGMLTLLKFCPLSLSLYYVPQNVFRSAPSLFRRLYPLVFFFRYIFRVLLLRILLVKMIELFRILIKFCREALFYSIVRLKLR